jgi:hypothetical protein
MKIQKGKKKSLKKMIKREERKGKREREREIHLSINFFMISNVQSFKLQRDTTLVHMKYTRDLLTHGER